VLDGITDGKAVYIAWEEIGATGAGEDAAITGAGLVAVIYTFVV